MVVNFRHRSYSTASDILIKPDRNIVKLWGRIEDIELPYKVGEDRTANAVKPKATIRDLEDNLIDTVEFSEKHFQKLIQMQKNAEPVELLCEIAPYKFEPNKWRNRLYVLAVASGASPLSRTQPSDADLRKVEAYLLQASTGFQLLGEIRDAVCEKTATVLSSDAYKEAVDFIIFQSLSGGFIGKTNGRLHSCVIGAPGIGKRQLVEIIKLINPVFEESQPERVNIVGLTGTQVNFGGLWGVKPGKLQKANTGIFVIQDFDKCNDKNTVFNVFNSVMEQGTVIVTGAATAENDAAASIHIDMNRKSHLYANRVPMTQKLHEILVRRYEDRDPDKPWVFWHRYWSRKQGQFVEGPFGDRKKLMKRLCEKAGVRHFRFHPIRHSGASIMDGNWVPLGAIQRILGHENRRTTEIYLHSMGDSEREAMRVFERARQKSPHFSHTGI